ncbi:MAG: sigma-70 family RNA polymerase sigma factor [Bacilli bacterium]|nr:sigma-70 family RNA polymerase sigma factor [Bacilli bacterium]
MDTQKLVDENKNFIYKIARSFSYNENELEDLFQVGVVGLLKAYKNYKSDSNAKFSTYAYYDIYGEMYKYINNRNIKVSKDYLKIYKMVEKTKYALAQKLNRIPTNREIANFLELDELLVEEAVNSGKQIMSLDEPIYEDTSVYEVISDNKNNNIDDKIDLYNSLNELPKDQRDIIKYHYLCDLSQMEIAKKMGMTQAMVSRYEKKGIEKIKQRVLM